MKAIVTVIVLCASILVYAQTPAPKSVSAKTGAVHNPAAASRPSLLNPASLKARAPAVFKAKFTTTAGDFVVEVHREWAPLGADRFYNLIRYGYFTNAAFFRVVPGFVVQFGLSADPAVNKVWKTATIQDDPVIQAISAETSSSPPPAPTPAPHNCSSTMPTTHASTAWASPPSEALSKAWTWSTKYIPPMANPRARS